MDKKGSKRGIDGDMEALGDYYVNNSALAELQRMVSREAQGSYPVRKLPADFVCEYCRIRRCNRCHIRKCSCRLKNHE